MFTAITKDGTERHPRGLKGEQIPLISRIISVVEAYERISGKSEKPKPERKKEALGGVKAARAAVRPPYRSTARFYAGR
jgi:response regulator RpfG family c-di-GMP phosphodiesterase